MASVEQYMLTTIDNPYSPFSEFEKWSQYDEAHGYFTSAFLGRLVHSSDELSETDQELEIQRAIKEAVDENVLGLYKRVTN